MPSERAAASAAQASGPGVARWTSSGRVRSKRRTQRADARQPEAQLAVHRDRATGGAQFVVRVERRFARLARPDQLDHVTMRAQVPDRALDGERDAVQLGRLGFGDVGDAHGRTERFRQRFWQSACSEKA